MIESSVIWPHPGKHVLAVSGGADSMVLLDLMARAAPTRHYDLIVAHFDHGIRPDSERDRRFVQSAAVHYGLEFEFGDGKLGPVSEAVARSARHEWLVNTLRSQGASGLVTAHHQDDLLETSLLNLARGAGRHGLAPMQTGPILRPLIGLSRAALRRYAVTRDLDWREDPTNLDRSNPRNFLRHELLQDAPDSWRSHYLEILAKLTILNTKIDQNISEMLQVCRDSETSYLLPRMLVRDVSLAELEELLVAIAARLAPGTELDHRIVKEIALFVKTAAPFRTRPLRKNLLATVQTQDVRVYYMGISKVGRR